MNTINHTLEHLELAQIGWVVPDIEKAMSFLSASLRVSGFHEPQHVSAEDLNMSYRGEVVHGEWLTTQTYSSNIFVELIQPTAGSSMFHDYLDKYPMGGTQHFAFRLPIDEYEQIVNDLLHQDYELISEVKHPIAHMSFFDTYKALGVATEIMGVTPDGWKAIKQMME